MNQARINSAEQRAQHLLGSEFAGVVRDHAERHEENLRRVAKAAESDNRRKIREAQNVVLTSFSSKLVCLVRAIKKHPDLTAGWVYETAAGLSAYKDPEEPVRTWAQPKSSGEGWRPVCEFGPKRRALQLLAGDVLTAMHGVEPTDYLTKGRGADIASDHITSLVEAGYPYFVLADIKDCFRSVQHESLRDLLGLPQQVIETCLLIGPGVPLLSLYPQGDIPHSVFDGAVRQGLPQGSRSSNLVMSLLLGPTLRSITSADRIIVHGDDIAVAAHSEEGGKALQIALSAALEQHPAGPFRLKRCEVANIHAGFDFLKYRHRWDPFTGAVKRRPAAKSYYRFYQRVITTVQTEPVAQAIKEIGPYRRYWIKAFPRWKQTPASKVLMQQELEDLVRSQAPGKWARLQRGRAPGGWK
ncbi:reverse transcriptase domain-containing protein [Methylobacterium durans]|uniref:Reverse transcriptase domain-containing protein n=1 Tax=Methylobacterium durans TaxID=2202825 RepID=A0A2U8WCC7_9HYPH|nr:reverse transcriptase domain-containing protein [Methylobacterium durans]AWN43815.1 hypothetical protein DK389_28965 [Methylobacterium durans]